MERKGWVILIVSIIVVVCILGFLMLGPHKGGAEKEVSGNNILFEKEASFGPCFPGMVCMESTKLYYSGKLVVERGNETQKQVGSQTINDVIAAIRSTGIMDKDCSAEFITDYSESVTLNIDNKEKKIQFPGCEQDMNKIKALIPS